MKTEESVRFYSEKILKIYRIGGDESRSFNILIHLILNFKSLPIVKKRELEKEAKKDLFKVRELLDFYKSKEYIKIYEEEERKPRNQYEKTILVFFKRCLKKNDAIVNYLIYEVDEIAIDQSRASKTKLQGEHFDKAEKHLKYPYKDFILPIADGMYDYEVDLSLLDYREINPYRHKVQYIPFNRNNLHQRNKSQLDGLLIKNLDVCKSLNEILDQVRLIPFLKRRISIFKEMKILANKRLWNSFYALALPQVEGLFQEMLEHTENDTKVSTLADKANRIAEIHGGGPSCFDYFEHYLPNLRNKFSHSGIDDGVIEKCYHLILDLRVLMEIFHNLETPTIKLNNIIKSNTPIYFRTLINFAEFFRLIKKVSVKNEKFIIDFVYKFDVAHLKNRKKLTKLTKLVIEDYLLAKQKLEENFRMQFFLAYSIEFNIFQNGKKKVVSQIGKIASVMEKDLFILYAEYYVFLLNALDYINLIKFRLSQPKHGAFNLIKKFEQDESESISIVKFLRNKSKPDLDHHFVLTEKEWKHIEFLDKWT